LTKHEKKIQGIKVPDLEKRGSFFLTDLNLKSLERREERMLLLLKILYIYKSNGTNTSKKGVIVPLYHLYT